VQPGATPCNLVQRDATSIRECQNEPTDAVFDIASMARRGQVQERVKTRPATGGRGNGSRGGVQKLVCDKITGECTFVHLISAKFQKPDKDFFSGQVSARLNCGRCDNAITPPHQRMICTERYASGKNTSSSSAGRRPTYPAAKAKS
jgi:hypothetical protein